MLNNKVNNWAVELETFIITFEHISGVKNTLADILSRIVKVDPDIQSEPEQEGYEFGYSCFEELLPMEVFAVEEKVVKDVNLWPDEEIGIPELKCTLPVPKGKLHHLQLKDGVCQKRARQVHVGTDSPISYCIDKDSILWKLLEDNKELFQTTVLPKILINPVLQLAHNSAGHNGFQQVYLSIQRLYYWNNMKKDILHHCKQCAVCEKFKIERIKFKKLHFSTPNQLMEFICMDLIGEFHPPTSRGHRYALMVMDMLTGFVFCAPLQTKKAKEIVQKYLDTVYYRFGGSRKILSDNGTEFKNKVFEEMAKKLGCDVRVYSRPYQPQSNGRIECFHKFLKACMGKYINPRLEWDEVIPMATVAYNFFPHTTSKERPFFLMFGHDPLTGLEKLFGDTVRYLGENGGRLDLTVLQNTYQLAAQNIQKAREKAEGKEPSVPLIFQPGNLVTLHDHIAKVFEPKYKGEYRIVKMLGKTQVLLRNARGEEMKHHVTHIKKTNPVEETVDKIPDFKKFGRTVKLCLNPYIVPNLGWEYEAAKVSTIACSEKSMFSTKWKLISKILILHSCVKFIYSSKPQKTLRVLNRYHKVMRCLCNANTNNVSLSLTVV